MRYSLVDILLFFFLQLLALDCFAQAACPPGMVPYGTGTDVSSCGPARGQLPSSTPEYVAPPLWLDRWGAIATDFAHSSAGASVNQKDKQSAEQAALENCRANGGKTCKIEFNYSNGCAALAFGDGGHNTNVGATAEEAKQAAMKECNAVDKRCSVYYLGCSLPVFIN